MILDLRGSDETILVAWDKIAPRKEAARELPKRPLVYEELEIVKIEDVIKRKSK